MTRRNENLSAIRDRKRHRQQTRYGRVFAARLDYQVGLVRREILQLPRRQLKADSLTRHMLSNN